MKRKFKISNEGREMISQIETMFDYVGFQDTPYTHDYYFEARDQFGFTDDELIVLEEIIDDIFYGNATYSLVSDYELIVHVS